MFRSLIFLVLILFSGQLSGQEVFRDPASFKAMGNASASLQSPLSVYSNPAGFAAIQSPAFGLQYENRFLLEDLQTTSAFLVFPFHNAIFGFTYSQFGKNLYRESTWSFGVAKCLSNRFSAAVQFHYFSLYFAENSRRAGTLAVDIGTQFEFGDDFRLGMQIFNPYAFPIQTLDLELKYPSILCLGIHKTFDDVLIFAIDARKQSDQAAELNCGFELRLQNQVQLRMGIESRLAIFSLGLGYTLNHVQTDVAFSYHQYLGYSPSFSIYYQLP